MKEEEILGILPLHIRTIIAGRHQLGRPSGNPPAHSKASHFKIQIKSLLSI